jgi:tetratricopeptide (TPR) repeat protein
VKRIATALTLLILASAASAFAADKPQAPFQVIVTSPEGLPVPDADIEISSSATVPPFNFTGRTDIAGKAEGELPGFTQGYTIKISKQGYKEFSQEVDFAAKKLKKGETAELKVTLPPITATEYYNEAAKAIRASDFVLANEKLGLALAADPKLGIAHAALAQVHLAQAEKAWLEQAKKDGKLDAAADVAALSKQHAEAALAAADQALAINADDVLALNGRFEALTSLDRKDEAEAALAVLAAKDRTPATAILLYNAGALASNSNKPEVARLRFQEALSVNPALHQAHSGLAELAIREKKLEEAVTQLDKAIAIAPRNFKAHDRRLEVLKQIGNKDRIAAAEQELAKLKSGS